MQMVAGIVFSSELAGLVRIAHRLIEIHDAIECLGIADPGVHRLAYLLFLRAVIRRALKGQDRRTDDLDATLVRSRDDLPIGCDQLLRIDDWRVAKVTAWAAHPDIVDSFEDD